MKKLKLKRRHTFNRGLLLFVSMLLFISIGLSYVQSSYSINGVVDIKDGAWDVHFSNISNSTNMSFVVNPVINDAKNSINFTLNLETRLDYYEFEVDVVNDGIYDAMVSEVVMDQIPSALNSYINYTVTYVNGNAVLANDLLSAKTSKRIKVRYSFIDDGSRELSIPLNTYIITFNMPYVQATSEAVDR